LKTDGTVWCWGRADLKQVGSFVPPEALCPNGSLTISCLRTPTIVPGLTGVASLAVGSSHVCALKTDGTVWCWGNNEFGQLGAAVGTVCRPSGYGPVPCVETPTRVAGLPDAAGIAAIGGNTCALMRDGTARCWGDGLSGQLGSMVSGRCDNPCMDTHCTPTPTEVPGLSGLRGLTLSLDNQGTRACAWRADGTVSCWGAYDSGFFGGAPGVACSLESRCTHGERPCTPTPLTAPGLTNVEMLTRGCALTRTGGVLCWGDNFSGQLGDGTVTHRRTPAPVVF
jgi:alpha-tubulin suppressor-like RCC1 family protein